MGCDSLETVDQVEEEHAALDAADSVLQSLYMMRLDNLLQLVNRLRQRINSHREVHVVGDKCLMSGLNRVPNGIDYLLRLHMTSRREMNILLVLVLGNVSDIHAIVAHTLQVADGVQYLIYRQLIFCGQTLAVDPYDISRQYRLTFIDERLIFLHKRELRLVVFVYHACCEFVVFYY